MTAPRLTGPQKAAALVLALGEEQAAVDHGCRGSIGAGGGT